MYSVEEVTFVSGGRPGLILHVIDERIVENVPFSLIKTYVDSDCEERKVLTALAAAVEDYHSDTISNYTSLSPVLFPIPIQYLQNVFSAKNPGLSIKSELLFDLADDGMIIYEDDNRQSSSSIRFTSTYTFFNLKSQDYSLTWKEAAALKMPTGLFHSLADDVALRYLRMNAEKWLGLKLLNSDPSCFDCSHQSPYIARDSNCREIPVYTLQNRISEIQRLLHKEYVQERDSCGADGIIFVPTTDESTFRVIRMQLKLGSSSFQEEEITRILADMEVRGAHIYKSLEKIIKISEKENYLVTTRFVPAELCAKFTKVIGPQQLASVWPDEIKGLGNPYASNLHLTNYLNLEDPNKYSMPHTKIEHIVL